MRTKEITKERSPNKRKNKGSRVPPQSSSADAVKEGVGRNSGSSSPAPSLSALLSSSRSRSSRSDNSLPASFSAGVSLPTSVCSREEV